MIACLSKNDPVSYFDVRKLKPAKLAEAQGNQVRIGRLYVELDPKPGELTMSRVSSGEIRKEARTRQSYKSVR